METQIIEQNTMSLVNDDICGSNEEAYDITLELPYTNMDAFKQKALAILRSTISMSALCDHMYFRSYGTCEFTNENHTKAHITETDRFTRGKIHCAIYQMFQTKYNPGIYDICIIFTHTVNNTTFYNYVMLKCLLRFQ